MCQTGTLCPDIIETFCVKQKCAFGPLKWPWVLLTSIHYCLSKSKSNLHYTRRITPKRVTSCGAHLRDLAPGQHSSEETSQRWRVVGDTVSI